MRGLWSRLVIGRFTKGKIIVAYIDAVDIVGGREEAAATLKMATVGVRVRHNGDDGAILAAGGRLLRWLEETRLPPHDIAGPSGAQLG